MYEKLIEKIVNDFLNHNSISNIIVGLYGNSEFESELFAIADKCVLDSFKAHLPVERKAQVVVALTYLASTKYDGNLWNYIRDAFPSTYDNYLNSQYIDGKIRSILSCFKSYVNYSNSESYVAVPLVLSGVTHYWLDSFFDFCFQIYKNRMLANGDISDQDIKKQLFLTFSALKKTNKLNADNDVIKFGESHTYQLSKYTQSALSSGENLDGLVEIGAYCIRLVIDSLLDKKPEPQPFYTAAFDKWYTKFNSSKSEKEELNERRKLGVWKSSFLYDDGVYLLTKTRWVDDSYNPFDIKLLILNDNKIMQESELNIESDEMGALIIKSKRVYLEHIPLGKLKYQIVCSGEILFDSESEMFRNVIFFNGEDGTEIFPTKDFDGGAIVVSRQIPSFGKRLFFNSEYVVTEFIIRSSSDYVVDNVHYGFKTIRKPGLEGTLINWICVQPKVSPRDVFVYSEINHALFEAPYEMQDIKSYLDDEYAEKNQIELVELSSFSNGIHQYRAILKNVSNGYHIVKFIANGKEINRSKFEFILDTEAKQEVSDEYLSYSINFLGKIKKGFIEDDDDFVSDLRQISGLGPSLVKYGLFSILISFDNSNWIRPSERIDFSTLNKSSQYLYIKTVGLKSLETKTDIGKLEQPQCAKDDNYGWKYRTPCGFLFSYDSTEAKRCKLTINNEREKAEFFIDYVAYIDESSSIIRYESDNKNCICQFAFSSSKKLKFQFLRDNKPLFVKPIVVSGEIVKTPVLKAFNIYEVVLTETKGIFGKEKECFRKDFYFCDKNDLLGHVFEIDAVDVFGEKSNFIKKLTGTPVTIKFLRPSSKENDLYYGSIMQRDLYASYKGNLLTKIGPIQIRVEDEFEDNKLWVYIYDKDEDMLCYNAIRGCIHNSTNDVASCKMDGIERFLIHLKK